jgi:hypothetical protein
MADETALLERRQGGQDFRPASGFHSDDELFPGPELTIVVATLLTFGTSQRQIERLIGTPVAAPN